MSIYASTADIGVDDAFDTTGTVLAYPGSHLFPAGAPHAYLMLAQIPGHCVPGHDDDLAEAVARYLRVSVASAGHLIDADVILTEAAATELRDELDRWLALPKLDPADPNNQENE